MNPTSLDSYAHNRAAWNAYVARGNQWTLPASAEVIAAARRGEWSVVLTPEKAVPRAWFGTADGLLHGKCNLGLASGGGQQCPIFAAAGAEVSLLDASDAQLAQDRAVAEREGLRIETLQGNMKDLSAFESGSFDLVFNPCSVCFVDDVKPVWREVARVLKPGGALLTGIIHPWFFLFDSQSMDEGRLEVKNRLPYRDQDSPEMMARLGEQAVEFSHSFDDLLGGQMSAGLVLTDLFEDNWKQWPLISQYAKGFLATRALKLPLAN